MALRNHEIDKRLGMTRVNPKDKSSAVSRRLRAILATDRHSPRMQTMSPICQRHNDAAGRPHLHHCVNNKMYLINILIMYYVGGRRRQRPVGAVKPSDSLDLSSLTFQSCVASSLGGIWRRIPVAGVDLLRNGAW